MRQRLTDHPELMKEAAASVRREIPEDFKYNAKKLKHLKRILHNTNVALGTLTSALNEFSKLKGPEISPDGLLGGIGYILSIKDLKQMLNTSVHNLSDIADSIADELTNPRWNAREDKEVKELIKEKDDLTDKAEEVIEEEDNPENESDENDEDQEEEISPDDVIEAEDIEKEAKIREVLASAVEKSLVNFFVNK